MKVSVHKIVDEDNHGQGYIAVCKFGPKCAITFTTYGRTDIAALRNMQNQIREWYGIGADLNFAKAIGEYKKSKQQKSKRKPK